MSHASKHLILETDGAARGNPGLAGAGIIIKDEHGRKIETIGKFLGVTTNNQAEYRALIEGLQAVQRHGPDCVTVRMDSELVVKQMSGQYRVRHPEIVPLYLEAVEAVQGLSEVRFEHVPRERNPGADRVANFAIDSRMIKGRGPENA
jgi:ribonuclease HI